MTVKRQHWANSCGAASLLCAAAELGIAHFPANPNPPVPAWQPYGALALTAAGIAGDLCERLIYQVTSGNEAANPPPNQPDDWGYSLPSGVVRCARLLGLRATVYAYRTKTVWLLKKVYSAEIVALQGMNALNERAETRSVLSPGDGFRELRIFAHHPLLCVLHYVMVRPNGTVMEPGEGQDHGSIRATKAGIGMHGTGLSIFLRV